jgi:TnpA family transposase
MTMITGNIQRPAPRHTEISQQGLHILQSSLGLVNTLMIQDTVALPEWEGVLTDADRRGLDLARIS